MDAMKKLSQSSVLISGMNGIGIEIGLYLSEFSKNFYVLILIL